MDADGWCLFATPIGHCALAWRAGAIVGVQLPEGAEAALHARMQRRFGPQAALGDLPPHVAAWVDRITAVLYGRQDDLADLPLDYAGVGAFEQRVYEATRRIAPGRTLSYGELATALGEPGAARAIGQALGRNPFAPVVPCHRVLAARNGPGGFSAEGGVATKLRMLQAEAARFGPQPGLFDTG